MARAGFGCFLYGFGNRQLPSWAGYLGCAGLLHLCRLPISFVWRFELVALSFATVYIVVFTLTRRLDKRYRQCQVLPYNAN